MRNLLLRITKLSEIRNSCPEASDELIALIFTKVEHQCNIEADYMIASNAIAPLPTVFAILLS